MAALSYQGNLVQTAAVANVTTKAPQVPAPGANLKIVVLSQTLTLDAAGEFHWESASTDLTGLVEVAADTVFTSETPLVCAANEALSLTATTAANGWISYVILTDP